MLGVYLHIPFCKKKCAYCDFVSVTSTNYRDYFDALKKEVELYADKAMILDTVFFGGGTPSLVEASEIVDILKALRCGFAQLDDAEISIEVNPGTVDAYKLQAYRNGGVNRISFGLQSADDKELNLLGRIHSYNEFLDSYHLARQAGFDNINIDIIFGLPNQTLNQLLKTIDSVVELNPEHVSCYALKLEKGTSMYRQYKDSKAMPDEDTERDMYHAIFNKLNASGYIQYETSNFAKPGFECQHNLKYWTGEPYLGFGAAAHALLKEKKVFFRQSNLTDIDQYIMQVHKEQKPIAEKIALTSKDIREEYIMLRMRLRWGINFIDYQQRFNLNFRQCYDREIKMLEQNGLIVTDNEGVYPTLKGFDLQNTLITTFLMGDEK